MKKIIIDTNFLLIPEQFKVDIISEIARIMDTGYKLYVIDKTVDELNGIIEKEAPKYRDAAKIGLLILKKNNICEIKTHEGNVDDLIFEAACEDVKDTIVATQDRELKARLKKKGVKAIALRQKHYLILA